MVSNVFSTVLGRAKEVLSNMREARERLDDILETALTIRTASSNITYPFMQVCWNTYNMLNIDRIR